MSIYPLEIMLSSIADTRGKKRLVFNPAPLGGINSRLVIAFFILLPIAEYAIFFNPYVFKMLGIATAIVAYIVCLSLVMIIVFLVTWGVNRHVVKKITPSWEHYFSNRELALVLSTGVSPYSEFFAYYAQAVRENISNEELQKFLENGFVEMEEKNKDLLDAIKRNTDLSH